MRLLVMGATGRLGRKVVEVASERGHDVTAFARDPGALDVVDVGRESSRGPNVSPFPGDALQPARVAEAVAGHDAVVSALGRRGDEPTLTEGLRNLLTAMRRHGVRRIVLVGGQGVLDDPRGGLVRDRPGFPPFLEKISAEHLAAFREVQASNLDWTMLCPPRLADDADGPVRLFAERLPAVGATLPNAPVGYRVAAEAIVDVIEQQRFVKRRVGVVPVQSPREASGANALS